MEARRGCHPLLSGESKRDKGGYSHGMSPSQMRSLSAMCEAFIPPLLDDDLHSTNGREDPPSKALQAFFHFSGSDSPIPDEVAESIVKKGEPEGVALIRWVMWLLATRLGTLLLCGTLCLSWSFPFVLRFPDMPVERREELLKRWTREKFWIPLRMVFLLVKIFCFYSWFSMTDENNRNPTWEAIGYCRREDGQKQEQQEPNSHQQQQERPLDRGIVETKDESNSSIVGSLAQKGLAVSDGPDAITVHCDAVVIGSGCGGGVAAAVLAGSGHKVVVLEKGNYFVAGDYSSLEGPSMDQLYQGGGLIGSVDGKMMILAGSTVGGGSAVNWSACIKTPPHVLQEWSEESKIRFFATAEYADAVEAVWKRIGVTEGCDEEGLQNRILRRGCESLGLNVQSVARNSSSGHFCGSCCYGCPTADKRGTDTTWLVDAVASGAVIVTGCEAERLVLEPSAAGAGKKPRRCVGVTARCVAGGGVTKRIVIKAKATVSACGSLRTPPLLLSSGLKNRNIGRNLRLHPVMLVWGHFPEPAASDLKGKVFEGGIITSLHKVMDTEDSPASACRAIIESPTIGPASLGTILPWVSGKDFKRKMVGYSRMAHLFALVRDHGSGSVDAAGRVKYSIHEKDKENLKQGARRALRILVAAGATEVGTHQSDGKTVRCKGAAREEEVEEFLDEVAVAGGPSSRGEVWNQYCSAHQMGSCRMGASEEEGALDGDGQSWEAEGLFVCDASVLPSAVGVNPMITVEATAYCISARIHAFLKAASGGN